MYDKNQNSTIKHAVWGIIAGIILTSILVIAVRAYSFYRQPYVKIGNHIFRVEIADTPEKQRLGLMFRKHLASNRGMLFIFDKPDIQTFWMKNTYIPLDIIFIDANNRIINIVTMPALTRQTCRSLRPALYVLEISAGLADKLGIKPGDKVFIRK